ncbi:MAG: SRPBCC domain-containing protein [Planctomycetota bacterium]
MSESPSPSPSPTSRSPQPDRTVAAPSAPSLSAPGPTPRQFAFDLDIDAPRDAVWRALVDPREIERWFAPDATVEPRLGGRLTWRWRDLHTWVCTIETWQPGEHLRLRYDSAVDDGAGSKKPLMMDFVLAARGSITTLRLVHAGFGPEADFRQEYDGISRGWPVELHSLKLYLERHRGQNRVATWFTQPTHLAPDASWARLVGPQGLAGAAGIEVLRPGAPFALRTPDGDEFRGTALVCSAREFTGVVDNLHGAWLRVSVETFTGASVLWFWLATYGEDPALTRAREGRLRRFLADLFPATGGVAR